MDAIQEIRKKEGNEKIAELFNALVKLANGAVDYKLTHEGGYRSDQLKIEVQVYPENHESYYKKVWVYFDLRGNGLYHHTDYKIYVRIGSDSWEINHKRNWTFDTKDLAGKVHTKMIDLVSKIKYRYEKSVSDQNSKNAVIEKMVAKFPDAHNIWSYPNSASVDLPEGSIKYDAYSSEYRVEIGGLSEDQLDRILAIKRETVKQEVSE